MALILVEIYEIYTKHLKYRVLIKIVFFPTATHPLHVEEQLILERHPSVQSLLLVDHFCTANIYMTILGKNTIFNEHPVSYNNVVYGDES